LRCREDGIWYARADRHRRVRIIDGAHSGVYTVMDTGPAVKGRKIDIFMASCERAAKFGEQQLRIRVLRRGWSPKATANR